LTSRYRVLGTFAVEEVEAAEEVEGAEEVEAAGPAVVAALA
jgi:hypothetical protein